ncbi:hypothetical protein CC86DRAFT_347233 [Ophiobolus disseminans]|uniref:Clr5 domain-containing protein n=1 Tax=Ophiobolus disseminans TaxID=1469910 RepID=A0A6A7A836_9PLEO|nr:hypothetical protein CC86DRAFT_347233 [Ophiobolus disseminans]
MATSANRWEELKPVIESIYFDPSKKLSDVVLILKRDHNFDALEHQYKYQFKKWKWKKNMSSSTKNMMVEQIESRARAGKSGTNITLQGRAVEKHKIRRHMKNKARDDSKAMAFVKWNLPFAVMLKSHTRPFDHASPLSFSVATPGSDIAIDTPSSTGNTPSPTTALLEKKKRLDRAHLFAQGQHDKLLMSMDGDERSFKTAKHWGKGPRNWTAQLLDFGQFHSQHSRSLPGTPGDHTILTEELRPRPQPEGLCRWMIHLREDECDFSLEDEVPTNLQYQDPYDETTWSPWPHVQEDSPLPARLRDALEHNDFSSIAITSLPVAVPEIAQAAQRSPDELLVESLAFSIMSRNSAQVQNITGQLARKSLMPMSIYPFHMATSYLDGYTTCCDIFTSLLISFRGAKLRELFVNELGHTILDNLFMSILKSHSSAKPVVADASLKDTSRFVGEEVDVCGRWDADSPCVRQIYAEGVACIPFAWKHKFCHTSIQSVCHCIILLSSHTPIMVESASGLYVRRCFDCGKKLELGPLHSLVMTAYHLASSGCVEEDLFGILACLLCLLSCRLDPRTSANISVAALLQTASADALEVGCDHEELTPAQLAKRVSALLVAGTWTEKAQMGWEVFCGVLFAHNSILRQVHFEHHEFIPSFRTRKDLASLWASVQAEILSYRRLENGTDWISPRFSMKQLKHQLAQGQLLAVGYVEQNLLQPHCVCGNFNTSYISVLPDATDAELGNVEVWDRATYGSISDDF